MSTRTELPTPRRLEQARRQGDVARSRLFAAALTCLGAFAALAVTAPAAVRTLCDYARWALAAGAAGTTSTDVARARALQAAAQVTLPVLGAALLFAVLGGAVQVGVLVRPGAVAPQVNRLSPGAGLKRIFSRQGVGEVFRGLVVGGAVVALLALGLRSAAPELVRLPAIAGPNAIGVGLQFTQAVGLRILGTLVLLGALDWLWQRRSHRRRLMMTREELKRELKETEGDPQHKAHRKALHRAISRGTAARGVQTATVVVVNPTHLAVALRYEPSEASAPTIVAKGREDEAARIRQLARTLHVPIVRDVPLARALFPFDVGEEIPEELYEAAAVVLRKVYAMSAPRPVAPSRSPR